MSEKIGETKRQQKNQESTISKMRTRYRLKNEDKTSTRYECFCSRQYLSYAAVWQHLKKNHYQFHRANKYFSATNIIQTHDPLYGFKIKKILKERVNFCSQKQREQEQRQWNALARKKQSLEGKKVGSTLIDMLQKRLNQSLMQNSEQSRMMMLNERKIQKYKLIVDNMIKIIYSYEQILRKLKIQPIVDELNRSLMPTYHSRDDADDEQYIPER